MTEDVVDYDNPETGVHFQWSVGSAETGDGEDQDDPLIGSQVTLSVNFNRPTPFVLEAATEAEAFANAFAMQMIDVQEDGVAKPFDRAAFTDAYVAHATRIAASMSARIPEVGQFRLPRAELQRIWAWNVDRDGLYDSLGDDVFVPKITLWSRDGALETFVTWGDGVPMCLPAVNTVFCFRDETAPSSGFLRRKKTLVEPISLAAFLGDYGSFFQKDYGSFFQKDDRFGGYWIANTTQQIDLFQAVSGRAIDKASTMENLKTQQSIQMIPFHAVLDAEFFD